MSMGIGPGLRAGILAKELWTDVSSLDVGEWIETLARWIFDYSPCHWEKYEDSRNS